jgi:tripartite-type tricarboxylate transporter receptor subunit TctC
MRSPDVLQKLMAQGAEPSEFTVAQFAQFVREETRRWTDVIHDAGIRIEQ